MKRKIVLRVLFVLIGVTGSLIFIDGERGLPVAGIVLAIAFLHDESHD